MMMWPCDIGETPLYTQKLFSAHPCNRLVNTS